MVQPGFEARTGPCVEGFEIAAAAPFQGHCTDIVQSLQNSAEEGAARDALVRWIIRRRDVTGIDHLGFAELLGQTRKIVAVTRARSNRSDSGRRAITVHQAKNREFDIVVVIWPYTGAQDDEGKRRLLHNAITRAKLQCTVIVQGIGSKAKAPFR